MECFINCQFIIITINTANKFCAEGIKIPWCNNAYCHNYHPANQAGFQSEFTSWRGK